MRNKSRWVVPGAVGAAIVAAATVPGAFASTPSPDLPPVSAADLIASVRSAPIEALSGALDVDAALGLPALPDRLVGSSSGGAALLTGSHTVRLWVDGPDRQRLALPGDLAETDVVHNGSDLWTYDSSTNTVTHRVLPQRRGAPEGSDPAANLTPQAATQRLLADLDPSTAVAVTGTSRVAGRPTYRLTLTPRTSDTLVRSVRIDIDATNRIPLRVQVFGAASTPAWSTGFSSISFATPAASQFRFTPPAGSRVNQSAGPAQSSGVEAPADSSAAGVKPHTVGSGWATVFEFPAAALNVGGGHASVLGWLGRAATVVPEGRLVSTNLVSLLITPDGRAFVGAVPPAVVRAAAAAQ